MRPFSTHKHPTDSATLVMTGPPSLLADIVDANDDRDYSVTVGGLLVMAVSRNAAHDSQPAVGFILTDEDGRRPAGRLILIDRGDWHDEAPEWHIGYPSSQDADEDLLIWAARKERPKVSMVQVDYDWTHDGDTLEEATAAVAARFGVSVTVKNPRGPGGGAAIIEVTGLTDNVEKLLCSPDGWNMDDEDVQMYLG